MYPDFVSPNKRKRCCGDEVAGSSKRFLKMSESVIASISNPFVAVNTKKNTDWALTVFQGVAKRLECYGLRRRAAVSG